MSPRDVPPSVANSSKSRFITIRSAAILGLLLVGFILFIVTADAAGIIQSAREENQVIRRLRRKPSQEQKRQVSPFTSSVGEPCSQSGDWA
ncbi:MAG TPA: hypothetical protein VM848_06180 [Acidimicrobiia bacterium]|nr:hypothetical protein [Acidimicrobiia bacterium]